MPLLHHQHVSESIHYYMYNISCVYHESENTRAGCAEAVVSCSCTSTHELCIKTWITWEVWGQKTYDDNMFSARCGHPSSFPPSLIPSSNSFLFLFFILSSDSISPACCSLSLPDCIGEETRRVGPAMTPPPLNIFILVASFFYFTGNHIKYLWLNWRSKFLTGYIYIHVCAVCVDQVNESYHLKSIFSKSFNIKTYIYQRGSGAYICLHVSSSYDERLISGNNDTWQWAREKLEEKVAVVRKAVGSRELLEWSAIKEIMLYRRQYWKWFTIFRGNSFIWLRLYASCYL